MLVIFTNLYITSAKIKPISPQKDEKKKQRHFDNGKSYMNYLKSWKSMVENMKTNKSSASREKVC